MTKSPTRNRASTDVDGVLVGNVYDKYNTRNPVARWLMQGFLDNVTELYAELSAESVLDVGCGEGLLAQHLLLHAHRPVRFEACDLSLDLVAPDLDPLISFRVASACNLPYQTDEFDVVLCCEVLEHLDQPQVALKELVRVARQAVILSTPREPLWRIMNVARFRYLGSLGNTPGHVQHFSRRGLCRMVEAHLQIVAVRSPLPWSIVLGRPKS